MFNSPMARDPEFTTPVHSSFYKPQQPRQCHAFSMFIASTPSSLRSFPSSNRVALFRNLFQSVKARPILVQKWSLASRHARALQSQVSTVDDLPFRKHLKDEARRKRGTGDNTNRGKEEAAKKLRLEKWELTVGIEIHAQLNTTRKIFSSKAFRKPGSLKSC